MTCNYKQSFYDTQANNHDKIPIVGELAWGNDCQYEFHNSQKREQERERDFKGVFERRR